MLADTRVLYVFLYVRDLAVSRAFYAGTLAVQAALLLQTAPPAVFAAFCESRLGGDWGQAFGTLSGRTDFDAILQRAMPH